MGGKSYSNAREDSQLYSAGSVGNYNVRSSVYDPWASHYLLPSNDPSSEWFNTSAADPSYPSAVTDIPVSPASVNQFDNLWNVSSDYTSTPPYLIDDHEIHPTLSVKSLPPTSFVKQDSPSSTTPDDSDRDQDTYHPPSTGTGRSASPLELSHDEESDFETPADLSTFSKTRGAKRKMTTNVNINKKSGSIKDRPAMKKMRNRELAIKGERKRREELKLAHDALAALFPNDGEGDLTKFATLQLAHDAIIQLREECSSLKTHIKQLKRQAPKLPEA